MRTFRCTNKILVSNTYILSRDDVDSVYIIDPGDSSVILDWLISHKKVLSGILLTHAHFDHMYGLNDLLDEFTNAILYVSPLSIDGLFCVRLNTSLYHEQPFVLSDRYLHNIKLLNEGFNFMLWDMHKLFVTYTPGHTKDCVSFQIDNFLFSGDALIPGKKVFSRKKMSDSKAIVNSIEKIYSLFDSIDKIILLPGHGKDFLLNESREVNKFCNIEYSDIFTEIKKPKI
jgi:hydroxyacylglutathione hydrolase